MYKAKILDFDTKAEFVILNKEVEDPRDSQTNLAQIKFGEKKMIVHVVRSEIILKTEIGIPPLIADKLDIKKGNKISIVAKSKPDALPIIMKKYEQEKWSAEDLRNIVDDIYAGNVSDLELSAFTLAMQYENLSIDETEHLTRAFTLHGEQIKFDEPVYDKHSIGGIPGNKVSLLIVPIIAAAGLLIPKTSSRAITSPSGTADTMEVLCNVDFTAEEIMEIAPNTRGMIVWGGQLNLAPVDSEIIDRVERPLSLDPESVIIASILSKKLSTGVNNLVLDMPTGFETKIERRQDAKNLSALFVEIGRRVGIQVEAALTYADQPVGHAIGPALEAREAIETLMGNGPRSVLEKSNELAGILLEMSGIAKRGEGAKISNDLVTSGKALEKFYEIIEAQGADIRYKPKDIEIGQYNMSINALEDGYISYISNKQVKNIAATLGCPSDKKSGVILRRKRGEFVKKGDTIMDLYTSRESALDNALKITNVKHPWRLEGMVLERISSSQREV